MNWWCSFPIISVSFLIIPAYTLYDEKLARRMLDFAGAAYSSTPEICFNDTLLKNDNWRIAGHFNDICDFLNNTCGAFVAVSDKAQEMVVTFRGTTTRNQLLLEGYESLRPATPFYNLGNVQKYFKRSLDKIWPSLAPAITAEKTKSYRIIFTGHSFGGALASLAALQTVHLKHRSGDQVTLITFGQPRTGDATFAFNFDKLISNSFRLVNNADVIPHLPQCRHSTIDGKKGCDGDPNTQSPYHHGTEIWYPEGMGKDARYTICTGQPKDEDRECSDGLLDIRYSHIDHLHYFNHMISRYGKHGCTGRGETSSRVGILDRIEHIRNRIFNGLEQIGIKTYSHHNQQD